MSAAQIRPATISEDGSSRRLLARFSFEVTIMYGNVSVNDCIEELDLTVCSYKLLRTYGCSIVNDVLSIPLKSLVILGHKIQQIRRLFLQGRICLLPRKGLIDVPNAALKGIVLFVSE